MLIHKITVNGRTNYREFHSGFCAYGDIVDPANIPSGATVEEININHLQIMSSLQSIEGTPEGAVLKNYIVYLERMLAYYQK